MILDAAPAGLTRAGYRVIGTSRTAAAGEVRDGIRMIACDVTDDASVVQAVALAHGELGLSLIHICRCRRAILCRSRWSPYP